MPKANPEADNLTRATPSIPQGSSFLVELICSKKKYMCSCVLFSDTSEQRSNDLSCFNFNQFVFAKTSAVIIAAAATTTTVVYICYLNCLIIVQSWPCPWLTEGCKQPVLFSVD
ncbi:hypothetical protein T06_1602 [Trichinella sp. T6]|nr:hypothetical protein T06_1602 [Trichinella sp. T6]